MLLDVHPDLFLGFGTIGADGDCLNEAIIRLPEHQRVLLIKVMEHGSRLYAAKEVGGDELNEIIVAVSAINEAIHALRERFQNMLDERFPV